MLSPRPTVRSTLPGVALALGLLAAPLQAQRLDPLTDDQRCDGAVVVGMTFRGIQRDLLPGRLGLAARVTNRLALTLQPPTRAGLIRGFLLFRTGERCEEQARAESERILRAQPYISDAVIRAVRVGQDSVRLDVETIDEYVFYFESWGWEGLPTGAEVGTGNFAGTGRVVRVLSELGRGGEVGWGASYLDYQFAGRPLTFETKVRSLPLYDYFSVALSRPWYSNYQRDTWGISASHGKLLYNFRDEAIRDISLDYQRSTIGASWSRRLGGLNAPFVVTLGGDWERALPVRVLQIRDNGPIPVALPPDLARYGHYDHARLGGGIGVRRIRFLPVRALNALSAPEDVPMGVTGGLDVRVGIAGLQRDPTDVLVTGNVSATVGDPHLLLRFFTDAQWISARAGSLPRQLTVNGKIALTGKLNEAQLTRLSFESSLASQPRIPTQFTFRDGMDGVIGFRNSNDGGSQRAVARLEERHRIPSPLATVELGVAGLLQSGRLWAGDAPYGVNTGWRHGVGVALIVATPKGSRQTLRIELGHPLNPTPGVSGSEVRILYGDNTGRF